MNPEEFVNTPKSKTTPAEESAPIQDTTKAVPKKKARSIFDITDVSRLIRLELITSNLSFIFFIAFLVLLYIANNHYAMKSVKKLNQNELQVKQMKWEYINLKSELERKSQQSYIATQLESTGIKELKQPPQKIISSSNVKN